MSQKLLSPEASRDVNNAFGPDQRHAQQDWEEYLSSRPFEDDKGNARDPETGKKIDSDKYFDKKRQERFKNTNKAYESMTPYELTRKIAEAKFHGDKTSETNLYNALLDNIEKQQKESKSGDSGKNIDFSRDLNEEYDFQVHEMLDKLQKEKQSAEEDKSQRVDSARKDVDSAFGGVVEGAEAEESVDSPIDAEGDNPEDLGGENDTNNENYAGEKVGEGTEKNENDGTDDFEGSDDETEVMDSPEGIAEHVLSPEQQNELVKITSEIDAIDKMSNYQERYNKLRDYAMKNNGVIGPDGRDIGIEVAKRLDKSSARSRFNPRRYTIRFGRSRRHYNTLLAEMAQKGPNGANLEAAKAMKWNWDSYRYRGIVPTKNETLYKVSVILEKNLADLPEEIERLASEIDNLQNNPKRGSRHTVELTEELRKIESIKEKIINQISSLEDKRDDDSSYNGLSEFEAKSKRDDFEQELQQLDVNLALASEESTKKQDALNGELKLQQEKEAALVKKNQNKIDDLSQQYQYAQINAPKVDKLIDFRFMHAHKYKGKTIASRAEQRDDISLLKPLNIPGNKRKYQDAFANIIVNRYKKLDDQAKSLERSDYISTINRNIKNRAIKDQAIKNLI